MASENEKDEQKNVAVVVLGDIGRSPRMQYHAFSLAKEMGLKVSLIGYKGEKCVPLVEMNQDIQQFKLSHFAGLQWMRNKLLFPIYACIKVGLLLSRLLYTLLLTIPRPQVILVQNPPSIPSLFVVWLVCRLRRSHMVIDWHNLGYTVLGYSLGHSHFLVKVSKVYEKFFAGLGAAHFCVTKAMASWLEAEFKVKPTVLYDKAPRFFTPTPENERKDLVQRLVKSPKASSITPGTLFEALGTEPTSGTRPFLMVSSTSWTEDEDFSLLLDALVAIDGRLPRPVVLCVTGKGPQKRMYQKIIAQLDLSQIEIHTLWLEPGDYPKLLGSCDLGVCLHKSTSGLDLPMKVVDMFGCGLPVCAVGFGCLEELVVHQKNGLIFDTVEQLSEQILLLLKDDAKLLASLKENVTKQVTWERNWKDQAKPLLLSLLQNETKYFIDIRKWVLYCFVFFIFFGILFFKQ